jgi:D-lactate dehydrogenase
MAEAPLSCAVFDARSYDRLSFSKVPGADGIDWHFLEYPLGVSSAGSAEGCRAVCSFVNDSVDAACLDRLHKLGVRAIVLRCAGFNHVDLEAATRIGLQVTRVPAYSPYAVAEHAVALLQTLNRQIHRAWNRVREHNFSLQGLTGFDLHGKTVGLVGAGKIGRAAAAIFRGYGCQVLVYDTVQDTVWAEALGVRFVELTELWSACDVISLHVPLLPATRHLINASTLAQMKPGVVLVNTSRGKLVDSSALLDALKGGQLGGVALDVYEEEEGLFFSDRSDEVMRDDTLARLLTFPNVLVTAHQAFLTNEALHGIASVTVENLLRFARGEAPLPGTLLPPVQR